MRFFFFRERSFYGSVVLEDRGQFAAIAELPVFHTTNIWDMGFNGFEKCALIRRFLLRYHTDILEQGTAMARQ